MVEQVEHNKVAYIAMVPSKWNTLHNEVFCHLKDQTALTSRYEPEVPLG